MVKVVVIILWLISSLFLYSCNGKMPGSDAREISPDPRERVKKNLSEGKGFRLSESFGGDKGGNFDFASSNAYFCNRSTPCLDMIVS